MKSLLLIRHAKSSWDFNMEDFDRPLNQRGESDAPAMAMRLAKKEIIIDRFITSPALRAKTTAGHFADAYKITGEKIEEIAVLYEPTAEVILSEIKNLHDEDNIVAIFSHNPGITAFANSLSATQIDDIPTCGIFAIKAEIKYWKDFGDSKNEFWFFDYPKG